MSGRPIGGSGESTKRRRTSRKAAATAGNAAGRGAQRVGARHPRRWAIPRRLSAGGGGSKAGGVGPTSAAPKAPALTSRPTPRRRAESIHTATVRQRRAGQRLVEWGQVGAGKPTSGPHAAAKAAADTAAATHNVIGP